MSTNFKSLVFHCTVKYWSVSALTFSKAAPERVAFDVLLLLREFLYAAAPALWLHDAQHHECLACIRALLPLDQDVPGEELSAVTFQVQGQQQSVAPREGSIPSNSQNTFVLEFFSTPVLPANVLPLQPDA